MELVNDQRKEMIVKKKSSFRTLGLAFLIGLLVLVGCGPKEETVTQIKVGVIAPLTGSIPAVGQSTKNAAELAVNEVNEDGGLDVGGQRVEMSIFVEDDEDKEESAVSAAQKLINQSNVVAIIGPQASRNAVPASTIAESARIPMISPWSTNPDTTADKRYVFRVAFIDSFQGRVMARFAIEELGATEAAALYDVASDYNKGIAEIFKQVFEEAGGQVVAFETYTTGDEDFTTQLTAIRDSGADVLFLPNYYNEVPLQVRQARELGVEATIIGSDTWGQLAAQDMTEMEGLFFSTHYAPDIASDVAQEFIKKYKAAYGEVPGDVAALTYDAFGMLFQAIESQGKADPESIRNGLATISQYEGVTGMMEYKGAGDPLKSAVILQIRNGKFTFYKLASP
jgi:branched-chain amino acid transport system substrate-binding protein